RQRERERDAHCDRVEPRAPVEAQEQHREPYDSHDVGGARVRLAQKLRQRRVERAAEIAGEPCGDQHVVRHRETERRDSRNPRERPHSLLDGGRQARAVEIEEQRVADGLENRDEAQRAQREHDGIGGEEHGRGSAQGECSPNTLNLISPEMTRVSAPTARHVATYAPGPSSSRIATANFFWIAVGSSATAFLAPAASVSASAVTRTSPPNSSTISLTGGGTMLPAAGTDDASGVCA